MTDSLSYTKVLFHLLKLYSCFRHNAVGLAYEVCVLGIHHKVAQLQPAVDWSIGLCCCKTAVEQPLHLLRVHMAPKICQLHKVVYQDVAHTMTRVYCIQIGTVTAKCKGEWVYQNNSSQKVINWFNAVWYWISKWRPQANLGFASLCPVLLLLYIKFKSNFVSFLGKVLPHKIIIWHKIHVSH